MTLVQTQFIPKGPDTVEPEPTALEEKKDTVMPVDAFGYIKDYEAVVVSYSRTALDLEPSGDVIDLNALHWTEFMQRFVYTQGLFSLWRGLVIGCQYHMIRSLLGQVVHRKVEGLLLRTVPPSDMSDSQCNALAAICSNLLCGFALSPLELLRTRMIVQSSLVVEKKYKDGTWKGLALIAREEGGIWAGLYSRHAFWTICSYFFLPILHHLPGLVMPFDPEDEEEMDLHHRGLFLALTWTCNIVNWCLSLPIEVCRKRQFICPSPGNHRILPFITCIRIRPEKGERGHYNLAQSMYRIVKEEGTGALYKGWTLKLSSAGLHFAIHVLQFWTMVDYYEPEWIEESSE